MQKSSQDAKNQVLSTLVLTHYDTSLPFTLADDNSAYGVDISYYMGLHVTLCIS